METPLQQLRRLVNQIEKFLDKAATDCGAEHLSGPQGFIVMHLYRNPEAHYSIKDVEEKLKISKSVASNLVKRMEKNGFIQIQPSQTDKRVKNLALTNLGREKAANFENFIAYVHETLLDGISREEIDSARQVMTRLAQNIQLDDSES
ncbi:MarR family winged helix-turn-helix transcriptional regulator [Streptococcus gallinaceus]|uniref:DNA-binding MarR family transcriptional regulator n=1 Tax=Streptococcus gallinaceus TaxID=165758 RepID=A0ABV2JL48_9STRE|nr:MarR family winged helix-turn-helix transcriptional regulator [Streptococcus gallinaceus]MCP1638943.1 DNA-binding MarR family transcriptional regulator [Streptococcus gallinaceus]MCP1769813.1 DNA-binding MarR family transcriptional regulator [Streptococcus gallinaceus]CRH91560.1 transcriptional regulator SlyA [Chlamydia trachomatis]